MMWPTAYHHVVRLNESDGTLFSENAMGSIPVVKLEDVGMIQSMYRFHL